MTMTHEIWTKLNPSQRASLRDNSGLTAQLIGKEGWRVEVVTKYGETLRFIVGKSTGWKPCHLELARRDSRGGTAAELSYASVRLLYKV